MSVPMNSPVCVDASLIMRTLIVDVFSEQALALLATWRKEKTVLIAPALLAFEVTTSLRRQVHFKRIAPSQGEKAFDQFIQLPIQLSHRQDIFPLAWQLAKEFNRPTAYDTAYLALAQLNDCDFWTADEKLYNAVSAKLPWVKWIGSHSALENGQTE
jgi:predicted nucleic acid-binding protein